MQVLCVADVTRYEIYARHTKGKSLDVVPRKVVRLTPMRIRYNLINTNWKFQGFPEMSDLFELKDEQEVTISYRISVWAS